MSASSIVRELTNIFGAKLVAVMGGVKNTRTVRHWIAEEKMPTELARLQLALQIVYFMQDAGEDSTVIGSWFQGMNETLGDRAPALAIADDPLGKAQRDVMSAARRFVR